MGGRRPGNRQREQKEKEPEDRLARGASWATIIGVPIALAALVLAYIALGGDEGSGSGSSPDRPSLERIDLIPRNGPPPARPAVELMVHNAGEGKSVISRGRIEVLGLHLLPLCYTQGDFPTSQRYGAQLSVDAAKGDVVEVPLHQQIEPGGNDRFRIDLGLAGETAEEHLDGIYLFELGVSLVHDVDHQVLPMGTVTVSLPQLPQVWLYYLEEGDLAELEDAFNGADFYTPEEMWSSAMPCWRANANVLNQAAGSPAAASQSLEEALRGAIVPSYSEAEA